MASRVPQSGSKATGSTGSKDKKKDERGAKDDWEALKIMLDQHPSLKQRVLHKLKDMVERAGGNVDKALKNK